MKDKKRELLKRLWEIEEKALYLAIDMDKMGGLYAVHGKELQGAANIIEKWREEILKDINQEAPNE